MELWKTLGGTLRVFHRSPEGAPMELWWNSETALNEVWVSSGGILRGALEELWDRSDGALGDP